MLTSVQRIWLYSAAVSILILVAGIAFNISASQKLSDIRVLSEIRAVANALELYRHVFARYPAGNRTDIRTRTVLSENGFSAGSRMFYGGTIPSKRPVTYHSDEKTYTISFTLRETWGERGLAGRLCEVKENAILTCKEK